MRTEGQWVSVAQGSSPARRGVDRLSDTFSAKNRVGDRRRGVRQISTPNRPQSHRFSSNSTGWSAKHRRLCPLATSQVTPGEHRRLRNAELVARNIENFSANAPPISEMTMVPDWTNSAKLAWPPRRPSFAAEFATSVMRQYDPRYSSDWAAHQAERANTIRAEQKRLADYYENLTEQQEDRENAEERSRAAAMGHR